MTTTFDELLKKRSAALASDLQNNEKPKPLPNPIDQNEVNINLVLQHQRIDIWFKNEPEHRIKDSLNHYGFDFRLADKTWEHFDDNDTRRFINRLLNTDIEMDPDDLSDQPLVSTKEVEDTLSTLIPEKDLSPFGIYKDQVDSLLLHFNCEMPELQLKAIDTLHKITFSN